MVVIAPMQNCYCKTKNLDNFPILIEYKGYKNKLIKLDTEGNVQNTKADNTPNYTNIKGYAVNGAIHYANALLHYTGYSDVISIPVLSINSHINIQK